MCTHSLSLSPPRPVNDDGSRTAALQVPKARAQLVQVTAHLPPQPKSTTLREVAFINANDLCVTRMAEVSEIKVVNSQTNKPVSAAYVKVSSHSSKQESDVLDGWFTCIKSSQV